MATIRASAAVAALTTVGLLLTACSSTTPSGGAATRTPAASSAASLDPTSAPTTAARAAGTWAGVSTSWPVYQLTVTEHGSGGSVRATTKVDHGSMTTEPLPPIGDPTATPPALAPAFPRTVDQLLTLAGGATATDVVYDPTGIPLRIDVDPIPNAIDDEVRYTVEMVVPSQRLLLAPVTQVPPPRPERRAPTTRPEAIVSRDGRTVSVVTWGGSTCWPVPVDARAVASSTLLVDAVDFPTGPCTANLGPHRGSVAVRPPAALPAKAVILHEFVGVASAPSLVLRLLSLV